MSGPRRPPRGGASRPGSELGPASTPTKADAPARPTRGAVAAKPAKVAAPAKSARAAKSAAPAKSAASTKVATSAKVAKAAEGAASAKVAKAPEGAARAGSPGASAKVAKAAEGAARAGSPGPPAKGRPTSGRPPAGRRPGQAPAGRTPATGRRPGQAPKRRRPPRPVKPVHPFFARYGAPHDTQGPKVRVGVLWAIALLCCLTISSLRPYALAFVMAAVAALAAGEVVDGRRQDHAGPDRWVAEAGASVLPLLAAIGLSSVAGGFLVVVVVAAVVPFVGAERGRPPFRRAGVAVGAAAICGGAGAAVVFLAHLEIGAIVIFIVSVLIWDASDYIVGSGAKRPWEGPVAAAVALIPVTVIFSVLRVPPFHGGDLWAFAFLTVLACPAGQLVASALLPTAASRAPALRRLDSLIVAAPAWAGLVALYLQRVG